MNAKIIKWIYTVKKKMVNVWYFCMKPLAYLFKGYEERKYKTEVVYINHMPLEEVARLYVKYTVKYIAQRKDAKEKYYCCTKKDGYSNYYDDCFILGDLHTLDYSRFNKTKLKGWYYSSPDCKGIGYGDGSKERWIDLENKLRILVEKEFIRVGCNVEFVDESDRLDKWFIKQSGYEKTMIVTI